MEKWIYKFAHKDAEGNSKMREILGGKGANLAEMCNLGIKVPAGFTIITEICRYYYENSCNFPENFMNEVAQGIKYIENHMDAKFGDPNKPLLISVRSGARASMPGMMDSILNLGLNDKTAEGLAIQSSNPRFAYDSYRRFIQMYASIVLDIDHGLFEDILQFKKDEKNIVNDTELNVEDLKSIIQKYKEIIVKNTLSNFPEDPQEQLYGAIQAVCKSWMNSRAKTYRKMHNIPESWGTAVNIQAMVYGNMGDTSATRVIFTRDPSNGEKKIYGEYLINAQGEDVVAGIRTPAQISIEGKNDNLSHSPAFEEIMPKIYEELKDISLQLENHYRDMQDIEFTVQQGKLWILQTRSAKRTAKSAIKVAADMVYENLITKEEAILRIDAASLDQLLHPMIDNKAKYEIFARGLPASPGAVTGAVVFSAEEAERKHEHQKVILVRIETSPEDIHGMIAAEGIVTSRGGMTSHAAVVARGMGKVCICGASSINIDYENKLMYCGKFTIKEGDIITINGGTGEIIIGEVPTIQPELSNEFNLIISWADEIRRLKIRANAETEEDSKTAKKFGCEGIGLCRTEHMFFSQDRIVCMREMIMAHNIQGRIKALDKLLPMQRDDFIQLFNIMGDLPITIRLLDPPLHEFLPHTEQEMIEVAKSSNLSLQEIKNRVTQLRESNPMLGHRGCRLAISYPEIYEMQAEAIFEAASIIYKEHKKQIFPEIMIPLVLSGRELELMHKLINDIAIKVEEKYKIKINYFLGTMIELPRAAICADEIVKYADFFSFGTNDLTQTTCGISRDDSVNFIGDYKEKNIFPYDPFVRIDEKGVGELIKIAIDKAKKVKKDLKLGICGEHGGNPSSIEFFDLIGLDYVSCSPYRIPIAKLAAAQAKIKNKR